MERKNVGKLGPKRTKSWSSVVLWIDVSRIFTLKILYESQFAEIR